MSVVSIPIVNKNYQMGCEDGQEARLVELGRMVDARAREILDKIGPLPESALLATLCIVLADEVRSRPTPSVTDAELKEILARIREIKHKIS
ncbi:MAG: cell division protein ZapA [Alphaproteobacteria bacterium]|nr:cell division protein ZapA [Alphaproteobacteria bacterium]